MFLRNIKEERTYGLHPQATIHPAAGHFQDGFRVHPCLPLHLRRFYETSLLGLPPRLRPHRPEMLHQTLAQGAMFL